MLADKMQDLVILINGKDYRPLKKILNRKELLGLVELSTSHYQIYLLDEHGKKIKIDSEDGVELQSGMRFVTAKLDEK